MAATNEVVIAMLKEAYSMELETVMNYLANSTNLDGVRETGRHDEGKQITLEAVGEVDALVKAIAAHRALAIESVQPTLEEEFMALYESGEGPEEGSDA